MSSVPLHYIYTAMTLLLLSLRRLAVLAFINCSKNPANSEEANQAIFLTHVSLAHLSLRHVDGWVCDRSFLFCPLHTADGVSRTWRSPRHTGRRNAFIPRSHHQKFPHRSHGYTQLYYGPFHACVPLSLISRMLHGKFWPLLSILCVRDNGPIIVLLMWFLKRDHSLGVGIVSVSTYASSINMLKHLGVPMDD
jgi:hypothetical protein